MRESFWLITILFLAGCQSGTPPASKPDLVEPATFSKWPSVTAEPVQVYAYLAGLCRSLTPEEAQRQDKDIKRLGPHVNHSIIVRVSQEAMAPFRESKSLSTGAIVVKEKYANPLASGQLYEYAMMIKQEAGYYPEGGDWEYVYVNLVPERKVARGRLTQCAGCHASAKERDYLFRSYGSRR